MSTQNYVNRVNQSFIQDELNKIGPEAKSVRDTSEGEKISDLIVEQAAADLAYAAATATVATPDSVEDPSDSIGNTADSTLLNSLIVSRVEFDKFKAQVIMALRHSGVDTRKFFN